MTVPSGEKDRPLRIVIADDQASVREGLVLLLGGLPGIEEVGAAADGQQALGLVAAREPDAILLDLHMPVLDGLGTTRRLVAEHPGGLTQREVEILSLIARGLTNPEIAAQLFLSSHTIKTHINRIFAKTGSRDRAAAIGYAHRHHLG
jgi:DNA-binding NarL/FixJ family response regulator